MKKPRKQTAFTCHGCGGSGSRNSKDVNYSRSRNLPLYCSHRCYAEAKRSVPTTDGKHRVPEYQIWNGMIDRCRPTNVARRYYYDRGISVCEEWKKSFHSFFEHIGPRPSKHHSIDRIDNNKGYEPGNVRWATREEQSGNRRCAIKVRFRGRLVHLAEVARVLGIPDATVTRRYHLNGMRGLTRPLPTRLAFSFMGETKTLSEWSKKLGIKYATLYQRIRVRGLSFSDAVRAGIS